MGYNKHKNVHPVWWVHAVLRVCVLVMLTLLVIDWGKEEVTKDLGFFYVNWIPTNPVPGNVSSDCNFPYSHEKHILGIAPEDIVDGKVKMCLDKNIWVGAHQTIFEKDDDTTASIVYNMVDNDGGCSDRGDQCCRAFRAMFGTNLAVIFAFTVTTLFMIIRHPGLGNFGVNNRKNFAPGNWVTITVKLAQFIVYLIVVLYYMGTILRGPRCNENFSDAENEHFGEDIDDKMEYGVNFALTVTVTILFFLDFLGEVAARSVWSIVEQDLEQSSVFFRGWHGFGTGFGAINKKIGSGVSSVYNVQAKRNKNETQSATKSLYW